MKSITGMDSQTCKEPVNIRVAVANAENFTSRDFLMVQALVALAPVLRRSLKSNQRKSLQSQTLSRLAELQANHAVGERAPVGDFAYRMAQAGTTGSCCSPLSVASFFWGTVNLAQLHAGKGVFVSGSEVALRLSLGAHRIAVARQLLIENRWVIGVLQPVSVSLRALPPFCRGCWS